MQPSIKVVPREAAPHTRTRFEPKGQIRNLFGMMERGTIKEIILGGPAGTGKTRGHLELGNLLAELYPGSRGLIVRLTRSALTQTAMVTFDNEVLAPAQHVNYHAGKHEYQYPNGSVMVIGGLDDQETADQIMSGQYDHIHVVECTQIGEKAWSALTTRLRNNRIPYQLLIGCCNPRPGSWVVKRATRGDCQLLKCTHDDNPSITDAYVNALKKLRGQQKRSLAVGDWGNPKNPLLNDLLDTLFTLPEAEDQWTY